MRSVTYRPVGPRIVVWACTALLIIVAVVIGRALPEEMKFQPEQTATIVFMLVCVVIGAHAIGRSHVTIDDQGLIVVNGFRRHQLDWDDIAVVSMRPGAPWPTVESRAGDRFIMFGIQGSDHGQTRQAMEEIRERMR